MVERKHLTNDNEVIDVHADIKLQPIDKIVDHQNIYIDQNTSLRNIIKYYISYDSLIDIDDLTPKIVFGFIFSDSHQFSSYSSHPISLFFNGFEIFIDRMIYFNICHEQLGSD